MGSVWTKIGPLRVDFGTSLGPSHQCLNVQVPFVLRQPGRRSRETYHSIQVQNGRRYWGKCTFQMKETFKCFFPTVMSLFHALKRNGPFLGPGERGQVLLRGSSPQGFRQGSTMGSPFASQIYDICACSTPPKQENETLISTPPRNELRTPPFLRCQCYRKGHLRVPLCCRVTQLSKYLWW